MHIPLITKKPAGEKLLPSINTKLDEFQPPNATGKFDFSSESSSSKSSNSNTNLAVSNKKVRSRSISNSKSLSNSYLSDEPASPSSLSKRQISEKLRQTPSGFVRNSRIYSGDSVDFASVLNKSDSFNSMANVSHSKNVNSFSNTLKSAKSVPPELSPMVSLFNCHSFRTYFHGDLLFLDGNEWVDVSGKLTGNELSIWSKDEEFHPKYFNLFDYNITLEPEHQLVKFSNDLNESFNTAIFKFDTEENYISWVSAMFFSNFEKLSLNEAFTAVILSLIGPKLSDIHTLLSKKKFPKYEWVNIRLPQVNHKWLKCYLAIYPSTHKKTGKIEIYQSEKISKKNLICYISDASNVYNIFPENVNMIEFNSLMKLNGDIYVNSKFEHLFSSSGGTFNKSHQRTASQSSFFSNSSSPPSSPKVKNSSSFIKTDYIYLMPTGHPGVQEIETMIRNYIPILDCFKLYGRPAQLNSNKYEKESLLFGLPSLPKYEYLPTEDVAEIVRVNLKRSVSEKWTSQQWFSEFRNTIEFKMANENYKGSGNISHLYKSLELDDSDLMSIRSFPEFKLPQGNGELSPSPYAGSPKLAAAFVDSPNYDSLPNTPNVKHTSPLPNDSFRFEAFDNIDTLTSPVVQLGELDEPINLHPYRQKA